MSRAEGFAAIPNWLVRDSSVSPFAIAVYVALASHTGPGGIHPARATIAAEARCSERKVGDALNELEALGVLERVRRVSKAGRAPTGYVLHPHGRLADDEVTAPDAGTLRVVTAPGAGGSGTGEQIALYTEEEPMKKNAGDTILALDRGADLFAEVWEAWPKKAGKQAAIKAFKRAIPAHARDAAAGAIPGFAGRGHELPVESLRSSAVLFARAYAASRSPEFVPHLSTWLNGERWTDDLPVVEGAAAPRVEGQVW